MSGAVLESWSRIWLNAWDDKLCRQSHLPRCDACQVLDVVYWGHRQSGFGRGLRRISGCWSMRFGTSYWPNGGWEHPHNGSCNDPSSNWGVISSTNIQPTTATRCPSFSPSSPPTETGPRPRVIFLRLVGEIDYNDGGNCGRYGLCDWYTGEGFNANFRAALFTDTMACPVNACSEDTITVHAQDLEADKLATACQRMFEEGQAFQDLVRYPVHPGAGRPQQPSGCVRFQ